MNSLKLLEEKHPLSNKKLLTQASIIQRQTQPLQQQRSLIRVRHNPLRSKPFNSLLAQRAQPDA